MEYEFDPFFVSRIREGKCVLFAGAGISVAAGYPNWASLIQGLMDAASKSHPEIQLSVARTLISEVDLLEAAAYLREEMGSRSFFDALRTLLTKAHVKPSATHELLARFPFRAILTTNFDQLIEQATGGKLPVATQNDARDLVQYLGDGRPFLFKVHGDIDRPDTIVLTPKEFTEVTVQNEAYKRSFSALVLTNTLLFIGYSHSHPDLNLFLREHVLIFGKDIGVW